MIITSVLPGSLPTESVWYFTVNGFDLCGRPGCNHQGTVVYLAVDIPAVEGVVLNLRSVSVRLLPFSRSRSETVATDELTIWYSLFIWAV
ncbi:hypothetical protein [Mesotoga sp.]|uniref:hypothetical protein n=1 Tax=Mesotoga sp. TaxID=2053577 RepID=UPI00345E8865